MKKITKMKNFKIDLQMFDNTFLTVQEIADQALLRLRENEVFSKLVWRDFDAEFAQKKGDTIQVKVPNTFEAKDFTGTIVNQDITESNVLIKLDQIADVSVPITSKQKTLDLDNFTEQIVNPAVEALASKIDNTLAGLYVDIPYFTGTSGTTPSDLKAFAYSAKILNENNVPMGMRRGVWDPSALAEFQQLDKFVELDKSGTTEALREGAIGKAIGIENYMDQNIKTHVAGTFTAVATPLTAGVTAVAAVEIVVDGGAGTETIKKGDLLSIGTYQFTATADAVAVAGEVTIPVYPAVKEEIADGTAVVFPDKTSKAHTSNLVFHRNAFVFVNRPMDSDLGGVDSAIASFEGLSIRVIKGFNQSTKVETMSFDILYGVKTVHKELAVRVLG